MPQQPGENPVPPPAPLPAIAAPASSPPQETHTASALHGPAQPAAGHRGPFPLRLPDRTLPDTAAPPKARPNRLPPSHRPVAPPVCEAPAPDPGLSELPAESGDWERFHPESMTPAFPTAWPGSAMSPPMGHPVMLQLGQLVPGDLVPANLPLGQPGLFSGLAQPLTHGHSKFSFLPGHLWLTGARSPPAAGRSGPDGQWASRPWSSGIPPKYVTGTRMR